jgi:hypothetical protein
MNIFLNNQAFLIRRTLRPLWRALCDFRMDFCDLIVSMEQAQIGPRPIVGSCDALPCCDVWMERITWLAKMERYSVRTGPWPGKIVSPCVALPMVLTTFFLSLTGRFTLLALAVSAVFRSPAWRFLCSSKCMRTSAGIAPGSFKRG